MYTVTGTLKAILDTQTFPSGFTKREFVVTVGDDKYPQDIKYEVIKDKCDWLNQYSVGQQVTVNFDLRGNEHNGKYYINLNCWKIEAANGGGQQQAPAQQAPAQQELAEDEIPF